MEELKKEKEVERDTKRETGKWEEERWLKMEKKRERVKSVHELVKSFQRKNFEREITRKLGAKKLKGFANKL